MVSEWVEGLERVLSGYVFVVVFVLVQELALCEFLVQELAVVLQLVPLVKIEYDVMVLFLNII